MLPNDIVRFEIFIFGDLQKELECLCLLGLKEVKCKTKEEISPNLMFLGKIWEVFGDFKEELYMRKKNFKGRMVKKGLPKCGDVCRTYDPIMTAYAEQLSKREDVEELQEQSAKLSLSESLKL